MWDSLGFLTWTRADRQTAEAARNVDDGVDHWGRAKGLGTCRADLFGGSRSRTYRRARGRGGVSGKGWETTGLDQGTGRTALQLAEAGCSRTRKNPLAAGKTAGTHVKQDRGHGAASVDEVTLVTAARACGRHHHIELTGVRRFSRSAAFLPAGIFNLGTWWGDANDMTLGKGLVRRAEFFSCGRTPTRFVRGRAGNGDRRQIVIGLRARPAVVEIFLGEPGTAKKTVSVSRTTSGARVG